MTVYVVIHHKEGEDLGITELQPGQEHEDLAETLDLADYQVFSLEAVIGLAQDIASIAGKHGWVLS